MQYCSMQTVFAKDLTSRCTSSFLLNVAATTGSVGIPMPFHIRNIHPLLLHK